MQKGASKIYEREATMQIFSRNIVFSLYKQF